MTDKCKLKDCVNKLVHVEGRRKKEFCSPECRTKFHNMKKVTGVGRGRPKGSKNKIKYPQGVTVVTEETKEIVGALSSVGFCQPYNNPTNTLTNAARGRDENGVNEDEMKDIKSLESVTFPDGSKVKDYQTVTIKSIPPNDPKEGSMAFMYKYGVSTYEELKNKK